MNPSTVRPEVSKGRYFLSVSVSLVLLYISTNGVNQSFPKSLKCRRGRTVIPAFFEDGQAFANQWEVAGHANYCQWRKP